MNIADYAPYLTVNGVSRHITPISVEAPSNGASRWNESNYGLGISLKNNTEDGLLRSLLLGQYHNSIGNNTTYAGAEFGKRLLGNDKLNLNGGVTAGLMTGYDIPLVPMILPTLSVGVGDANYNLRYSPHVPGMSPEVYMFNVDYKLPKLPKLF